VNFNESRVDFSITAMDPLSALSLAGTVVQFVEFGGKLLKEGRELYRSTTGSLTVNDELELVVVDLQALVAKLKLRRVDLAWIHAYRKQISS
jgi:hypothetical protein